MSAKKYTKRLYALDTNVLLRDPNALISFEEHDILLVDVVLEELDNGKKGDPGKVLAARSIGRSLRLMSEEFKKQGGDPRNGIPLSLFKRDSKATGMLYFENPEKEMVSLAYRGGNNDTLALLAILDARKGKRFENHKVIFVTKDNLAAVKADRCGLACEDYTTDQVTVDFDPLGTIHKFGIDFWDGNDGEGIECRHEGYIARFIVPHENPVAPNELVLIDRPGEEEPFMGITRGWENKTLTLDELYDFRNKRHVFGIHARSVQQNFALNCLLDPEIKIVILSGDAGTGKTLLALAAGLEQVIQERKFGDVIAMRSYIPFGHELGTLPGDVEEKVAPWTMPFRDNLRLLLPNASTPAFLGKKPYTEKEILADYLHFEPLTYMQGRTLHDAFIIIDEAQNLEPSVLEGLMNRAGETSKIVILGNNDQISSRELTSRTTGLAFAADRLRGHPIVAIIHADRVERSEIASVVVSLFKRNR